jgi:hypothetical protein
VLYPLIHGRYGTDYISKFPIGRPQASPFHCPSQSRPKISVEREKAFQEFLSLSEEFNLFRGIGAYQWVTGERRQKNQ